MSGAMISRVPVHILTGFLGSGKTSLLRRILQEPVFADTAVIINEFGEVGLDHLLVRELAEDVVLLASGCICCALKDDLSASLQDLHRGAMLGEIPRFNRIVVETTGLADPLPILRVLNVDSQLQKHFDAGQVATTVDLVNGLHTLDEYNEAIQQIAAADCIVFTKGDMARAVDLERLSQRVAALNPTARQRTSSRNEAVDATIFETSSARKQADWHSFAISPGQHQLAMSAAGIASFVITLDRPVERDDFIDWLELLLASRGNSILRVKGYLWATGHDRPLAIQGVQHVLDRPEPLAEWPSAAQQSQLVFIAKHLTKRAIERSLEAKLPTPADLQLPES
jgi:G3E family GTPase